MKIKKRAKETPEGAALQKIYNKFGGTNKCAAKFGMSGQLLSSWKRAGKVPLDRVVELSKKFSCDPYLLNKKECRELFDVLDKWDE